MNSPLLFLVFNRPEKTRTVFECIRRERPPRLYVAADGPRKERAGEEELCREVREIAVAVDWPCELKTLFRSGNLGCGSAVSGAIDWFFSHEEEGIILEDDILADPSFFRFCDELLERFRDEERIMTITGDYFNRNGHGGDESYYFSRYPHMWGWATWKRAWKHYDFGMSRWPELKASGWLERKGGEYRGFAEYWTAMFDRTHTGEIDTWDYQWFYSCWLRDGLTATPSRNLCRNIGFGEDATHTKSRSEWRSKLTLQVMEFPLRHPGRLQRDVNADGWLDRNLYKPHSPLYKKIRRGMGLLRLRIKGVFDVQASRKMGG